MNYTNDGIQSVAGIRVYVWGIHARAHTHTRARSPLYSLWRQLPTMLLYVLFVITVIGTSEASSSDFYEHTFSDYYGFLGTTLLGERDGQ